MPKRKFTKYPSNYIKSATDMFGDNYPEYPDFIYSTDGAYTYKYAPKYLHDADIKHANMTGMYYKVIEVSENGGAFEPISQDDRYNMFGTSELDVYPDGFVGYIWNGRLNPLGRLEGDQVV